MAEIKPIAHIYTEFSTKFAIPRQSMLTDSVGKIVFEPQFRSVDAIRGLDGFSHLWLIWEFSENKDKSVSLTVRPPRLGGNTRMGVFATRSPFRPNNIGLSCVKIEKIDYDCKNAPEIYVKGADILDGTPIFDIKPYIPYCDGIPDAKGGFADRVKEDNLEVVFLNDCEKMLPDDIFFTVKKLLEGDPRPHYHDDSSREYFFEYSVYRFGFRVESNVLYVTTVQKFSKEKVTLIKDL